MTKVSFRKYTREDASAFKALNIEWLNKFFVVEAIDELVLSNPQSEILDKAIYNIYQFESSIVKVKLSEEQKFKIKSEIESI